MVAGPRSGSGTVASFSESRARRLAETVLTKTLGVTRGESVTVETWSGTLPWANAFVLECRRLGARPTMLLQDEEMFWKAVEEGGGDSLGDVSSAELAMLEKTDAYVDLWGPSDAAREAALPEAVRESRSAGLDRWRTVAGRAGLRLAVLYLGRVGEEAARTFHISPESWRRELVEASLVDPREMNRTGQRLAARLMRGSEVVIDHPNGTHLVLHLKGRPPFVFGGILSHPGRPRRPALGWRPRLAETVIPAGYVNVAVDEEYAEGRFVANVDSEPNMFSRDRLEGGVWEFSGGKLVSQRYRTFQPGFDSSFSQGGPGHDQIALLDFGLNPKIRHAPWMKDQRQGTVTVAIGGNRFFGGTSDCSFSANLHLSGSRVRIDGRTVVEGNKVL